MYLTGSNATMLSGDLATHLVGRYGAFRIQPLCLAEFFELHGGEPNTRVSHLRRSSHAQVVWLST
ncbi:AAA family ATPase [Corynebacterium phoceense]|uniref:AAA family ATPase n=1 Tax=Corynebacterium phoceense TaxID=1686286 RepID=UPI0034CE21AD